MTSFIKSKNLQFIHKEGNLSLFLRPLEENDAEMLCSAIIESQENLKPFMEWAHQQISLEKQVERIRDSASLFSQGITYDFLVLDSETKEFMMSATLRACQIPNKKSLEIGYWTSSKYCNKGIATLVTKILIVIGFEVFGCDRIEILSNKSNQKSLKVIEKCEFKFEGELRNYYPQPTDKMIQEGFSLDRAALLYALIKGDIKDISWYSSMSSKIQTLMV